MKICASCKPEENLNDTSVSVSLPQWLQQTNFVKEFIESMNAVKTPQKKTANLLYEIDFHPSMKNKLLLLWATVPSTSLLIKDAKSAYDNFQNCQITRVSKSGKAKIFLETPQIYYVLENNKKVVYPRHFHFVIREGNAWNTQVYTHIITPSVDKAFVSKTLKKKDAIVINSLPKTFFKDTKIHEQVLNLPVEVIREKGKEYTKRKIRSYIQKTFPQIFQYIASKQLKVEHVPMIVYCKNEKCASAEKWMDTMLRFGYYNLYHYKKGSEDFLNKS